MENVIRSFLNINYPHLIICKWTPHDYDEYYNIITGQLASSFTHYDDYLDKSICSVCNCSYGSCYSDFNHYCNPKTNISVNFPIHHYYCTLCNFVGSLSEINHCCNCQVSWIYNDALIHCCGCKSLFDACSYCVNCQRNSKKSKK